MTLKRKTLCYHDDFFYFSNSCEDGWKGETCSEEVEKVVLLKRMLLMTVVGLVLVIIAVFMIACYFYAQRR